MKLQISILAILTLSPITRSLGNTFMTTDMPDICKNENLTLTVGNNTTLHRGFFASPSLRCIKITGRNIQIEEGSFDNVPNLTYLDLAENEIRPSKLFSFGNLSSVRMLSLGGHYYSPYEEEPVVRYVYPSLEYLDLRNSNISSISILKENPFPKLTHLDLSGNRMNESSLYFLPNTLVYLDLSDNQVSSLSLYGTRNLLSLWLDNNNIEVIGDGGVTFTGLEKFVNLSMANNRISKINEREFKSMPNLRYLDLSDNQLPSPHVNVTAYLPSLETLILDSQSFEDVPFFASSNISTLSLKYNRIKHLTPSSFSSLPYLKRLYLSHNWVYSVHVDTFRNQNLLEELHLDMNRLSYLPKFWCQYMENLRYLNVALNHFNSLESVIYSPNLPILELHLQYNFNMRINSKSAQIIPENMTIYV